MLRMYIIIPRATAKKTLQRNVFQNSINLSGKNPYKCSNNPLGSKKREEEYKTEDK